MSTKRFHDLGDLSRHKAKLVIKCKDCGHSRAFSSHELGPFCEHQRLNRKLAWPLYSRSLHVIADRMRCSICGGRRIDWWPDRAD